ncbi:MAG: TraR/DksA C4-type zinc finger protein [Dissulfurispiraceae bacterium]|jgi:DnaK suppressor protein|nr:TraR/DksA C4-type zinc finger protein [Dissulfurispiraceae bacterium]
MPTKKTTKTAKCAAPAARESSASRTLQTKAKTSPAKRNDKKSVSKSSASIPASVKKTVSVSTGKDKKAVVKAPARDKKNSVKIKQNTAEAESFTDNVSDRNLRLRRLLLQKRQELLQESKNEIRKYVSGEKRQLVETVLDDGDLSVVDLSEDINLKKLSTHKDMLTKIDIALRKITEGTYGICEECGEEISEARLKVMPFAIYCREDQEKKEMMEKFEREME